MSSRTTAAQKKSDGIQHQIILDQMLQDESNKKCADCWARNPRWASWNLGVFLCIRCAGIHRNLGVHISRVKSVGLDSWTDEQITSMQNMGNAAAAAMYEANLPENLRYTRPESDQALEKLIRDKYERKTYVDKNSSSANPPAARSTLARKNDPLPAANGASDSLRPSAIARNSGGEELPHPDGKPLIEF